ncbi:uncharacterized protein LOC122060685 [Macadamia integrifolia]|uniref:uncharacterized protein LOC122060685 n=1 Tax=Macadamia integrifolia TaxID=60698 RepID=UPI001C52C2F7|nr:uncharacterized protein LOC122060685 [Macadamia integrifolia]
MDATRFIPPFNTDRRSFATVVGRPVLQVIDSLPSTIKDGAMIRLKIPQAAYNRQLHKHRFALLGRVNFCSISMDFLWSYINENWVLKELVELRSLGKGFIMFHFKNEADMTSIWKRGPVPVGVQLIRFQQWRQDFYVSQQEITHKLTWIRFSDLPQEYWDEEILLSMAKATHESMYGPFTRVVFENPPSRCLKCSRYGHRADDCFGAMKEPTNEDPMVIEDRLREERLVRTCRRLVVREVPVLA